MTRGPIKTEIADGQRYFDEPVYAEVSKATRLALEINAVYRPRCLARPPRVKQLADLVGRGRVHEALQAVALASTPLAPPGPPIRAVITAVSHYNRVPLRWMKPDGKGGLVPRNPT